MMRIGWGYDSHRFTHGDFIMLGGVKIPFSKGLQAHSDGDALLHALCDALLGALALGDIGQHFPDNDERYRGASSLDLLAQVVTLVAQAGYAVGNIDAVIICEAPKLASHIMPMREAIAQALQVEIGQVSVKATSNEGMGFIGRAEGLAAQVAVLLVGVAD